MLQVTDPIKLEIYRNLFTSIAEEMGTVLRRTAYSANIKERRDYSCALFDDASRLIAMGDHMPVHLGSMPLSVVSAVEAFPLNPGDVAILNDPFAGGTHLPDITLIAPVYEPGGDKPAFYVASRAHHSDVGGMTPGSMPLSQDIFQEGFRIPPLKLYKKGVLNRDLLRLLLHNVRMPVEREGDLAAQVGSLIVGEKRLHELMQKNGATELRAYAQALQDYAEKISRQVIAAIPNGHYEAEDFLDDQGSERGSGAVKIRVALDVAEDSLKVDFQGSAPQVRGPMNAVKAITLSAVYYVLRCLAPINSPCSEGLVRGVEVALPEKTVVNASYPSATAGGNVETSQRIVDVLLKALAPALKDRIPAASSGTMNNLSIGGVHPVTQRPFSYYETIGGGMGASPQSDGDSGIHTHMTNSLNTPIEVLERLVPVRVREYRLLQGSGGKGKFRGGCGIVRTLEFLSDCEVTILSDRRKYAPYGLEGGRSGKKGVNSATIQGRRRKVPGKVALSLSKGDIVSIETPGGGGWGRPVR